MLKSLLILIFLAVITILAGCSDPDAQQEIIRPVKVITVSEPKQTVTRVLPGKISPAGEVNLAFRVSNRIEQLPIRKGQHVDQGDILAVLDPRDFEIALRNISGSLGEARANLRAMQAGARTEDVQSIEARLEAAKVAQHEAELQFDRHEQLYRIGAVAAADVDRVRSKKHEAASTARSLEMELQKARTGARQEDIEAMQARIASLEAGQDKARSDLEDSVLRAPFTGYVSDIYVDKYDLVQAGQPVLNLQDTSRVEISVGMPEQLFIQKEFITSIHVRLESFPDHFIPARIKEVSTDASGPSRTYNLTAIMDRPEGIIIFPSMAADLYVAFAPSVKDGHGIIIPETALVYGNRVWLFDQSSETVSSREVVPGAVSAGGVSITKGLTPGDMIVFAGAQFMNEGQRVRALADNLPPSPEH